MWTPTTRKQHILETGRYQTDVTDEEWRVIRPHLPSPNVTGRPHAWPMRAIINGIFYVMRSGCPWRLLPSDLPPWSTIYRWFAKFRDEDRFAKIKEAMTKGVIGGVLFAAGMPVIGSKLGGIVEWVGHQENGLLLDPEAVAACTNALRRCTEDRDLLAAHAARLT